MWFFYYCTMLDRYYISIFNHYKKQFGKKSLNLALFYICSLELSIILAVLAFFMAFASQMNMDVMSPIKFWMLFLLISIAIIFKNWMRYNGKKRNILNAKLKSQTTPLILLWILPFGCLFIALILLQVP